MLHPQVEATKPDNHFAHLLWQAILMQVVYDTSQYYGSCPVVYHVELMKSW